MNVVPVGRPVAEALLTQCRACPWRLSKHGRRHPDGWYTKSNLRRLWAGIRRGEAMTCHPTDPNNPVPEGWRPVPADTVTRECRGAQLLALREWSLLERIADLCDNGRLAPSGNWSPLAFRLYRKLRSRGLTTAGVAALVEREMFAGTPLCPHPHRITLPADLDQPVGIDGDSLTWPITDEQITQVAVRVA